MKTPLFYLALLALTFSCSEEKNTKDAYLFQAKEMLNNMKGKDLPWGGKFSSFNSLEIDTLAPISSRNHKSQELHTETVKTIELKKDLDKIKHDPKALVSEIISKQKTLDSLDALSYSILDELENLPDNDTVFFLVLFNANFKLENGVTQSKKFGLSYSKSGQLKQESFKELNRY